MKSLPTFKPMNKKQSALFRLLGLLIATVCLVGIQFQALASENKSTTAKPVKTKARKQSSSSHNSHSSNGNGLAKEWGPSNELKSYKQNYMMAYSHNSQPNYLPTSPNPANQVVTPLALQDKEVKFQISLKHILADYDNAGTLWLGYTQLAFWQAYNQSYAQPFREIVYEPELIYSLRPNDLSIFNMGAVHQSIGQSNPSERSWNRVYVEPGIQFNFSGEERLIIQVRWWKIIQEASLNDNPDIGNYLGYRELNLRYVQDGGWKVNVMSRIRSTQVDIAAPLAVWFLQPSEGASGNNLDIHMQYFHGYGEGLLDYNQSHTTMGIGISFPF
jgi:phospholipase A1